MGEDDLLRPLRQFVGDRAPSPGRLAVALVPLDKTRIKAEAEKITNLQRYGAYTIHFGRIDGLGEAIGEPKNESWLYLISDVARTAQRLLGTLRQTGDCDTDRRAHREALQKAALEFEECNRAKCGPDWDWDAPRSLEGVCVDDHPALDLRCEMKLLGVARRYLLDSSEHDLPCRRALETAIRGCLDSITGAFLCARLIRLESEWETWRSGWLTLPIPKDTTMILDNIQPSLKGVQFQRHNVALGSPLPNEDYRYRFYAGAPSQTFYHFLASLYERQTLLTNPRGRRIFLVFGRRGVGKGHFFAALSGESRLREFRDAIGDTKHEWPAAFFNTGFSHEFSSVFDLFVEFLLQAALSLTLGHGEVIATLANKAGKPRIGRVERMALVLKGLAEPAAIKALAGRRIIVALSGMSTLFNRDGQPKNPQIRRLFNAMLCNEGREAPVDILLLSGERWLPAAFRPGESKSAPEASGQFDVARLGSMRFTSLRRAKLPRSSEMKLERALRGVNLREPQDENTPEAHRAFAHYLYPARASIVLASFFPSVGLVVALRTLHRARHPGIDFNKVPAEVMRPEMAQKLRMVAMNLLTPASEPSRYGDWADQAKEAFPWLLLYAAKTSSMGKIWPDDIERLSAPDASDDHRRRSLFLQIEASARAALAGENDGSETISANILFDRLDGELKRLFEACGRSRFAFTVLMATAYQCLVPVAEMKIGDPAGVARAINDCAGFLQNMVLHVEGFAHEQRITFIIEIAMRRQKERGRTARPDAAFGKIQQGT